MVTFTQVTLAAKQNVLVLYDPVLNKLNDSTTYSSEVNKFLTHLNEKYDVSLSNYDEPASIIVEGGLKAYDHLVLFPSSKKAIKNKGNLTQFELMKFINANGNIVAIGGIQSVLPEGIRNFLNELGIFPSPKNYEYIDHFNSKNGEVQLNQDLNVVPGNRIIKDLKVKDYNGNAALISNNEYLFPILRSSATGYTYKANVPVDEGKTWTFGEQGFLAVGLQALNNARLVWLGSEELLAEEDLYKWTFQQQGVLKLQFVQHHKADSPQDVNSTLYRIKDQVIYTIGVSEYHDGRWYPFEVKNDEDQLQLSFKMLDPYQRLNLLPLGPVSSQDDEILDAYAYYVNFTLPDHHGMFTFELDYKRVGLSYLEDKRVVTVRHLANDEFKRSWNITNAWYYMAATILVILAWFYFVVAYIFIGKTDLVKKNV